MSTQAVPEATPSRQNVAPTSLQASPMALQYSLFRMMPADVSTCGAQTIDGFTSRILATTSSMGGGCTPRSSSSDQPFTGLAFITCTWSSLLPMHSKSWDQR